MLDWRFYISFVIALFVFFGGMAVQGEALLPALVALAVLAFSLLVLVSLTGSSGKDSGFFSRMDDF